MSLILTNEPYNCGNCKNYIKSSGLRATWATFKPELNKSKKIHHPPKTNFIFPETELSSSNVKKYLIFSQKVNFSYISGNGTLHFSPQAQKIRKIHPGKIPKKKIFSQKKAFPIFQETETPNKLLIFQKTELSYISGNPKKLSELERDF